MRTFKVALSTVAANLVEDGHVASRQEADSLVIIAARYHLGATGRAHIRVTSDTTVLAHDAGQIALIIEAREIGQAAQ